MVRGTAAAVAPRRELGLTEPSFRRILLGGMPGFLREGFLPLAVFYVGLAPVGHRNGHRDRGGGRPCSCTGTSGGSAATGCWSGSPSRSSPSRRSSGCSRTAPRPISPRRRRRTRSGGSPSSALPSCAARWPAPWPVPGTRSRPPFVKAASSSGSTASSRWSGVCISLGRSALRLGLLLVGNITGFLVVVFVTGAPAMLALMAWSVWYAVQRLSETPASG